MRQGIGHAVG